MTEPIDADTDADRAARGLSVGAVLSIPLSCAVRRLL